MKRILMYIPIILLLVYFGFSQFEKNDITTISTNQLAEKLNNQDSDNILFVDVREPNEYETGYIEGMVNIPLSTLETKYTNIPKDAEVILFCRSGNRSLQAAQMLKKKGYTNLVSVDGGIQKWEGKLVK